MQWMHSMIDLHAEARERMQQLSRPYEHPQTTSTLSAPRFALQLLALEKLAV
jgi:hypothetical protein